MSSGIDDHLAAGHGRETVGGAQQGRLSGPREAHDHADLAGRHGKVRAAHREGDLTAGRDGRGVLAAIETRQRAA
jgi:hypothetical protein